MKVLDNHRDSESVILLQLSALVSVLYEMERLRSLDNYLDWSECGREDQDAPTLLAVNCSGPSAVKKMKKSHARCSDLFWSGAQ